MIPVIDLFAGPGGLGEGFSAVLTKNGTRVFDIKLSIEKDEYAHQTLELRSFLRQFKPDNFPDEYYEMVSENNPMKRDKLKLALFDKYSQEYEYAKREAWLCELGTEKFPSSLVDERIKEVLYGEKEWVLIGGPPCQAYSLVGRARNNGLFEEDPKVFLYREYLRIIAKHHPKVFVMENVKGLLSASLDGNKIFDFMKKDLKDPGRLFPLYNSPKYKICSFVTKPDGTDQYAFPIYYDDKDYLIKAENYGIPQNRHRVILLGIREDTEFSYEILEKNDKISLESVIGDLPKIRSKIGRRIKNQIGSGLETRGYEKIMDNSNIWDKYLSEFKKEFLKFQQFKNIKMPEIYKEKIESSGAEFISIISNLNQNHPLYSWFLDPKLKGVMNHKSRSYLLEDLKRYYFYGIYTSLYNTFPRLKDLLSFSQELLPKHANIYSGKFEDRFRVQIPDRPATTITSHISKDGHYFIHYDFNQCRSFTVREAARIQTFPDNYLFCGPRTAQYAQVGNAVPPFLAHQLAQIVRRIFI
jgi:DNA (cytosine-5)-methyltransferase 1